jgi:hypothetical protein
MKEKWTEARLYELLKERYEQPAYIVLPQVANATGWSSTVRYADALAMSLWPSRGLELHGFEIKVAKNDWRKELRQPDKSEPIQAYCDRWWIVAAPDVVEVEDLPPTWGLLVPEKKRKMLLRVKHQAPLLEARPINRAFFAAILRRVAEHETDDARIEEAARVARQAGFEAGGKDAERRRECVQGQYDTLHKEVVEFERVSGISLRYRYGHSPRELGEAVRVVLDGMNGHRQHLKRMRATAQHILEACDKGLATKKARPLE